MMTAQVFHDYIAKKISFDLLVFTIRPDVRRLSEYVYRRWAKKLPDSVEPCDIEQVMLMRIPRALEKWDPESTYSVERYVSFAMLSKAKKYVHAQRKAVNKDSKAPSRHVISFSRLDRKRGAQHDGLTVSETTLNSKPMVALQEQQAAIAQGIARLGPVRVVVEEYLSTGSVEDAASRLAANQSAREFAGVRTLQEARRAAWGIVSQFATTVLV